MCHVSYSKLAFDLDRRFRFLEPEEIKIFPSFPILPNILNSFLLCYSFPLSWGGWWFAMTQVIG